ncbi:TPA: phage tail assembly protein [Pasteurella multocida]|nr:phage tail assembly protein [Pasteurella multocida]HDR1004074.1 phage tail assembly protein [Pasteurella multocida]HDR1008341.1 phage tail assembly protein [Pasteurella multocida]HDR1363855.1 phage tail assembly protein [Pasteurella multocida]HDR1370375.1 phage tail assembly protein [Pasteurella multocida]
MELRLKQGLMYGDEPQYDVVLRDLTTGDLIDAELAAERLMLDKQGNPVLVASQVLFSYELLRRQIASIGKLNGPISLAQLRSLSPDDLALINAALETVESAKAQKVLERGRLDATSENI